MFCLQRLAAHARVPLGQTFECCAVQWEASARSSDFPARGDLLNMPTYDAVRQLLNLYAFQLDVLRICCECGCLTASFHNAGHVLRADS